MGCGFCFEMFDGMHHNSCEPLAMAAYGRIKSGAVRAPIVAEREKRTGSAQRAGKLQTMPDEFSIIKLSDTTRKERGTNMNDTAKCDREIGRPKPSPVSTIHRK